jgi:hypothetical protein
MAIRKFHSLAEAGRVQKLNPGTEEFSRSLRSVFRLASQFAPLQKFPSGVIKFRSIEEAHAYWLAWKREAKASGIQQSASPPAES